MLVALALGLIAPRVSHDSLGARLVFVFWVVVIYLLPVGALGLALQVVGIRVFPSDATRRPLSTQLWLPFDRWSGLAPLGWRVNVFCRRPPVGAMSYARRSDR